MRHRVGAGGERGGGFTAHEDLGDVDGQPRGRGDVSDRRYDPDHGDEPVNVLHEQGFVLPDALEVEPVELYQALALHLEVLFAHAHDDRVEHGREHQEKEDDEEYDKGEGQCVVMHDRCGGRGGY